MAKVKIYLKLVKEYLIKRFSFAKGIALFYALYDKLFGTNKSVDPQYSEKLARETNEPEMDGAVVVYSFDVETDKPAL